MTAREFGIYFPVVFPVLFVAMWLIASGLVWKMSGWSDLQEAYPDREEEATCRLNFQSGAMGTSLMGYNHVNYGNCLSFGICRSGLRVSLMWLFRGLWCKPFFVPWQRIESEDAKLLFVFPYKRLNFGTAVRSSLFISRRTFEKISERSNGMMTAGSHRGRP